MSAAARPITWIVAGSASWPSLSSPAPPPGGRKSRCSRTNTWCRMRKWASRSRSLRTARHDSTGAAAPGVLTVGDEREVGPATVVTVVLEEAHRGACLAPGAARGHPASTQPAGRQVGHHAPVHRLAILRRRGRKVFHQAAHCRPQRHHERIDAHVDGAPAALDGEGGILAHAEDHVGAHLARTERGHRALPGTEIALDPGPRLGRGDPAQYRGIEALHVDAYRVDSEFRDLVDHRQVPRWLELHLNRQAGGFADRLATPGHI